MSITGEKGSVKILYSESLDGSYLQNNYNGDDSSPEAAAVAAATAAAMAAATSCQQNKFQGNFLPLDNLNLAMGGLTLNTNSPPTVAAPAPAPTSNVQPPPASKAPQHSPQLPMNGGGTSGAGPTSGFAPFQPPRPPHQPITYTAGTFAQTKFGSTKLKSNAKKTNRMSPTEFSNYIKQRAMQKQGSSGQPPVQPQPQPQQPMNNVSSASNLMPIGMKLFTNFTFYGCREARATQCILANRTPIFTKKSTTKSNLKTGPT